MQPYQEASQEMQRQGTSIHRGLGKAASIGGSAALAGGTAALGGAALSRVLPFLSKYIPQDLAIKGLSKIDPRFGKFINTALNEGQSFDSIKEFIKEKAEPQKESAQEPSKDDRNILQQYGLYDYVAGMINEAGNTPAQAAMKIKQNGTPKSKEAVKKIEKDHKTDFASIVESIFGKGDTATPQQPSRPQSTQQPQQGGQGQQALMAMLQKLQQTRGVK